MSQEEQHKSKYAGLVEITVDDKKAYFKPVDRKIMALAEMQGKASSVKVCEVILQNCFVEGDREIIDDDSYFMEAMTAVDELRTKRQLSVKKL